MAQNSNRNIRRYPGRRRPSPQNATVITNPEECCAAAETIAEEFYSGNNRKILVQSCCDPLGGCGYADASTRCNYWPRFAHPRWLSCRELYNGRPDV